MTRALTACFFVLSVVCFAADGAHELGTEEDLISAGQRGDLSPSTVDAALEAMRQGVELDRVAAAELSELTFLHHDDIEPELNTEPAKPWVRPFLPALSASVRLVTHVATVDTVAPPVLLDARVNGPFDLSAGATVMTTRRVPASPRVIDGRLTSTGFSYRAQAPRFFAQWRSGQARVIVGTFTAGFAERLTLDTTRRLSPNGFELSTSFARSSALFKLEGHPVSDDFGMRDVFRGVAASVEDLSVGTLRISLFGFGSYQSRSVYQYELVDRLACDDVRAGCTAPPVYLAKGRLSFSTLPAFYDELTAGAHSALKFGHHVEAGVTGYVARPFFIGIDAAQFDFSFQPWSNHPATGLYGAVGIDAHARLPASGLAFHVEATRTFDQNPFGGGGYGVIGRTTWRDLELSLRYFDTGFANPNARPPSAPDEYDGQRARNELGARLKTHHVLAKYLRLSTRADFWALPFSNPRVGPAGLTNLYLLARLDFTRLRVLAPGVMAEMRNRNLAANHHGRCASGTVISTEGEPFDCSGDLYRFAIRLHSKLAQVAELTAQTLVTLADDSRYPTKFRVDVQVWLEGHVQPLTWLSLRLRSRYLNQDLDGSKSASVEESLWSFAEVAWLPREGTRIGARYDSLFKRFSTPEHRFSLDVRASF